MVSNYAVSQALISKQLQVQAQSYLDQARLQRTVQQLEMALALYDQAKVTFKHAVDGYQLAEIKNALAQALQSQTPNEDALRQRIAEVYFERGELLRDLGKLDKAMASYKKARHWGYEGALPDFTAPPAPSPAVQKFAVAPTTTFATSMRQPLVTSTQEKNVLIDYLFEKALSTLGSLDVSNKPSLFLVYAHDNPDHGLAEAATSKYLIDKLSQIHVNLYSDQTPMGQTYSSSPEDLKDHGKLEDILTSQLCLLPERLCKGVEPVDKVVVCCSEVLGSYLRWPHYENFYQQLRKAYLKDREQPGIPAIREVVRKFSQEEEYKTGFHHVLTEMAFLQIRAERRKDQHGIIPISLTPNSSKQCLGRFISSTTVRLEDIPRYEKQVEAGREVYPNQSRHWVLFKLIERLLVGSDEAKTFLNKFWQGYSECISRLKGEPTLGELEFTKLSDGIFDGIRTALHSQLAFTVQQQHRQLQVLNEDPKSELKEQYFSALKLDEVFEETLQLYVDPRGRLNLEETDTFHLLSKVQEFLNDKKVILLTGDSGAGKTTFNRILEKELWKKKREHDAIPLFISLANIDKPEHDLIPKALRKKGLSEFQIHLLKKEKQKFVFILDGYDEIRQTQNLYLSNRINQSDGWQGQMIISCRTEYLGQDYQTRFQPNLKLRGEDSSFQEVIIEPFSEEERNQYLEKYVKYNSMWTLQQYKESLEQPHLKVLVSTPFLLRVVLEALPYLEDKGEEQTAIKLRMDLYDQFVKQWFERNQQRLSIQGLTGSKREIFRELCDDGFVQHGIGFVKNLAAQLYIKNGGRPVINYSLFKDKGNWKDAFFGREEEKQLLREAWPLSRNGYQYRFIHKLLLEYFIARVLFDSFDECMGSGVHRDHVRKTSIYHFKNKSADSSQTTQEITLAPNHWSSDPGVVRWLTERVQQDKAFKEQLLAIIELSKTDASVCHAAANAITILVRAGVQFNGEDFKGIKIPGADLSYGVFDYTQFDAADLSEVAMRGAWLYGASMRGANLENIDFGEMPALDLGGWPNVCRYSPDGNWLVVGSAVKGCRLYKVEKTQIELKTKTSQKLELKDKLTFKLPLILGSGFVGYSVAFSPDSKWLASADYDGGVRLWSVETGNVERMFKHGDKSVSSVSFFDNGQWLASSGYDEKIKLWKVKTDKLITKEAVYEIEAHAADIESIAISSDNKWLASGSKDKTVKLWELRNGELKLRQTLIEHDQAIHSVSFSADNKWLACGGESGTLMLWKLGSNAEMSHHILDGHIGVVKCVAFSSDNNWMASAAGDNVVKLWKLQDLEVQPPSMHEGHAGQVRNVSRNNWLASGGIEEKSENQEVTLHRTFEGHTFPVRSVSFSPDGDWLASASYDGTLKLWALKDDGISQHQTLEEHNGKVWGVSVSADGKWLASGSDDKTVKLWEIKDKEVLLRQTLKDHSKKVLSVTISQDGKWLASGNSGNSESSESKINLWKLKDTGEAEFIQTLDGYNKGVSGVSITADNKWLACGGGKTVSLWKLPNENALHKEAVLCQTFERNAADVMRVSISPDGKWLACGSWSPSEFWRLGRAGENRGRNVELWKLEPESGAKLSHQILEGHRGDVYSVAFSSNGKWLATGGADCTVKLWELSDTGASLRQTFKGHKWQIFSVSFSPDNKWLASGAHDRTVKLWSLNTEKCQATIHCFIREIGSVAWQECTENSAKIIVGGGENMIRIFQLKREGSHWKSSLHWTSHQYELSVGELATKGAQNLSPNNARLIEQNRKNMKEGESLESTISFANKLSFGLRLAKFFVKKLDLSSLDDPLQADSDLTQVNTQTNPDLDSFEAFRTAHIGTQNTTEQEMQSFNLADYSIEGFGTGFRSDNESMIDEDFSSSRKNLIKKQPPAVPI